MLVVSMDEIPGYETQTTLGQVLGVYVRPVSSGFTQLTPAGSEVAARARDAAIHQMAASAAARGANAVLAMRFESSGMDICAYGTAVWVKPVSPAAVAQYDSMVRAGQIQAQPATEPSS
jgi:uncharacterized protein YbjQ (UPF0145 family)